MLYRLGHNVTVLFIFKACSKFPTSTMSKKGSYLRLHGLSLSTPSIPWSDAKVYQLKLFLPNPWSHVSIILPNLNLGSREMNGQPQALEDLPSGIGPVPTGWAPESVWKFLGSKRRWTLLGEESRVTQSIAQWLCRLRCSVPYAASNEAVSTHRVEKKCRAVLHLAHLYSGCQIYFT